MFVSTSAERLFVVIDSNSKVMEFDTRLAALTFAKEQAEKGNNCKVAQYLYTVCKEVTVNDIKPPSTQRGY